MNLQKRTLKKLKKLLIEERWFNNAEFDSLFIHTYLNTKALVLGHKSSIVILMDKRCDVLRISSSSIKETEEEILKANLMLREKLKVDTIPSPWKKSWGEHRPYRPISIGEDRAEVPISDFAVTLPPDYRGAVMGVTRSPFTNITQGENE